MRLRYRTDAPRDRVVAVTARDRAESGVAGQDRVRVLIQPTKDAKGAPTNTMSFEPPIHPH